MYKFFLVQRLYKLTKYSILFKNCDVYLCLKDQGLKIGLAKIHQGLYYLLGSSPTIALADNGTMAASVQEPSRTTLLEIHQRMGHPYFHFLKQMYSHMFMDIDENLLICVDCQLGKYKRASYLATNHRAKKPFQILHCDVWGLITCIYNLNSYPN